MNEFLDWLHNSVKSSDLKLVKITDGKTTVLGIQDFSTEEIFILGALHDLTFTIGNKK